MLWHFVVHLGRDEVIFIEAGQEMYCGGGVAAETHADEHRIRRLHFQDF
jgi:hypothetical protein